jgi:hypothetical protein
MITNGEIRSQTKQNKTNTKHTKHTTQTKTKTKQIKQKIRRMLPHTYRDRIRPATPPRAAIRRDPRRCLCAGHERADGANARTIQNQLKNT